MAKTPEQSTHLALLRGINVGGKNKLPMQQLAGLFAEAGCGDVRTYIQSGNVLFNADHKTLAGLAALLSAQIEQRFGLHVPVILRSAAEMAKMLRRNPFVTARVDEAMLHVYLLAEEPSAARIAALDLDRSPPDTFVVSGREIYLHLPDGVARTRLTNLYFDKQLQTVSTMRNWKTMQVLAEKMAVDAES